MSERYLKDTGEPAEGSIGSLDRNDEQPGSPVQSFISEAMIGAIVDTCIPSFRSCGQELIAAFDAPHLLANHCSSNEYVLYTNMLSSSRVSSSSSRLRRGVVAVSDDFIKVVDSRLMW